MRKDIQQQIDIGFSKQEIKENLLVKGFDEIDIRNALDELKFVKPGNEGTVSNKSIGLGILFVVVAVIRLGLFASGGSIFLGIGVITGVGMSIYHFTNKK